MRELQIANNMIALARSRDGKGKRSAMLRMIMPFLSQHTGDKLADAIDKHDSAQFSKIWDKVKGEITVKLAANRKVDKHHDKMAKMPAHNVPHPNPTKSHKPMTVKHGKPVPKKKKAGGHHNAMHKRHKAHAASVSVQSYPQDNGQAYTNVNTEAYEGESLRFCLNGVEFGNYYVKNGELVLDKCTNDPGPEEVAADDSPKATEPACSNPAAGYPDPSDEIACSDPVGVDGYVCGEGTETNKPAMTVVYDGGQTGFSLAVKDAAIIDLIKRICERMLIGADPCPLPVEAQKCETLPVGCEVVCQPHGWPECPVCNGTVTVPQNFDFNANVLELYNRLLALGNV